MSPILGVWVCFAHSHTQNRSIHPAENERTFLLVCFCVFFFMGMAYGGLCHKDHCKHAKDKSLDYAYKQFKHHNHPG